MATVRQLRAEIDNTESIKLITQALGDIATLQIKATRKSVQQNILYFQEISNVYKTVRQVAIRNHLKEVTETKNGKTVLVLLTSNYHFYGGIDSDLTTFFLQHTVDFPNADRIVVGSAGIGLLEAFGEIKNTKTMVFEKDSPSFEELKLLSELVHPYSKVMVFHSKFETLLSQKPTISDISENQEMSGPADNSLNYILEPEIGKMLTFFQAQVLILLFQAIFLDAEIARTAARMVSMNQAEDNADKIVKNERKEMLRQRKALINRRILESYAGTKHTYR